MNLNDFIHRSSPPIPWEEGDNIPWNEPGFSQRMLREHLSQEHDAASRRFEIIDQHVAWIHAYLLSGQPSRILDLACGPGLYTHRFSRLGHTVVGIDYSPASIEYAISTARYENLSCTFSLQDIRKADYPSPVQLVMLIYGELNIFRPADAKSILEKAYKALEPNGSLLLEPHPAEVIKRLGKAKPSWYSSPAGLFSDQPYLMLQEHFWDRVSKTAAIRYHVVDAQTGSVTRYAQTFQAYSNDEYASLLTRIGFTEISFLPGLAPEYKNSDLIAIIAKKPQK